MSKSEDDLKEAFAGESQANRKYLAFAAAADKEGMPQIAKLFRAAAHAETIHAHAHLRALGGVLDTSANLNNAITGENYEVVSMYPRMIRDAEEEGNAAATKSFRRAFEVEKIHEGLFRAALAGMGKEQKEFDYYVCPFCGYTAEGSAPERCPVCGAKREQFERIA
jgi:rubrerythrin